jgi:rubrerythrin
MDNKKRIKELKRKIEAVIIAIPREVESFEYYNEMAEQYEDQDSKEMFYYLAKQELAHQASLERILGEMEVELKQLQSE